MNMRECHAATGTPFVTNLSKTPPAVHHLFKTKRRVIYTSRIDSFATLAGCCKDDLCYLCSEHCTQKWKLLIETPVFVCA